MSLELCAVVVTYKRTQWLRRCIESVLKAAKTCEQVNLSIVININGPDSDSAQVAQALQSKCKVSILQEPKCQLPSVARNHALPLSQGQWILFIDDDAYVEEAFFIRFLEALCAYPTAAAIGGPNLTPANSTVFQRATGVVLSSRFATYFSVSRYRQNGAIRTCGEESLILCNLFVRRDVLTNAPFPKNFICGEENWMLQDLASRGHSLVYSPKLFVRHERRAQVLTLCRQVFNYGFGRGCNLSERPNTIRVPHLLPSFFVLSLIFMFKQPCHLLYVLLCFAEAFLIVLTSKERFFLVPVVAFLFPVIHVFYGIGVLWGLTMRSYERAMA